MKLWKNSYMIYSFYFLLNNKNIDGYLYSYEGSSRTEIDKLIRSNDIEIINNKIYGFAYIFDPPAIYTSGSKIKTTTRQELFEYIPEDSNLIVEIRAPEKFAYYYIFGQEHIPLERFKNLSYKDMNIFLERFFGSIYKIFRDFIGDPVDISRNRSMKKIKEFKEKCKKIKEK